MGNHETQPCEKPRYVREFSSKPNKNPGTRRIPKEWGRKSDPRPKFPNTGKFHKKVFPIREGTFLFQRRKYLNKWL